MPYITKEERLVLDHQIEPLAGVIKSAGQLNYAITKLVLAYIAPISYDKIASVTGVLTNVKDELVRRIFGRYEDHKAALNGDIEEFRWEAH